MSPSFKYRAFISYSHRDAKWAKWLHRTLEKYVVPIDAFVEGEKLEEDGSEKSRRLTPIFRDRDELPASGSLSDTIQQALESSENLIVLCSPNSAASQYVNAEIEIFRGLHSDNDKKIYALIIEGEPPECFPPALIADGAEPIAADAREEGDGKGDAKLKLIAGMLGVGFDRLKQREAKRQRNRLMAMVSVVSAVAVMTSVLALWALEAEDEANEARELAEQSAKESKAVLEFFSKNVMGAVKPKSEDGGMGIDVTVAEAIDAAEAKIEKSFADQPLIEASIRARLGVIYIYMGGKNDAILTQYKRAYELRKQELGSEHPETFTAMGGLINIYQSLYRNQEALVLSEKLVELKKKTLGHEHWSTISALRQLVGPYTRAGRHEEAIVLAEEILQLVTKTRGPEDQHTIASLLTLSNAYLYAGRHQEALDMGQKGLTLGLKIEVPGLDKPITNSFRYVVATCYRALGRHQEAISLLEEAVRVSEKMLGAEHSTTMNLKRNLASFYTSAGQHERSVELNEKILFQYKKTLGIESHLTTRAMRDLAVGYQKVGRLEDAASQYREALAAQEKQKKDQWLVHVTQKRLGAVLAQQKKYPEAETMLLSAQEGLNTLLQKDGPNYNQLTSCLYEIVKFYKEWGKSEKAAEWQGKKDALEESNK